ncbi:calpain-A-like isoform X1 [Macrobrachium rosenbergii]|uniref:calpain-A-like isoform X1 n=1 Tax=Macrobrachium rosenbergii TaxID=79674 RepID=UPI0034D77D0E
MAGDTIDELSEKKHTEHDDKTCRCYKHLENKGPNAPKQDDIEGASLQKSTYYTRVATEYSTQRMVKPGSRPAKKGFTTLRDECLKANRLFEDPEFPPNDYSINFDGVTRRSYVWKRPHELVKDAHLFVEGASRFDIQQGELGDCWLLAAISNLTLNPRLFHVVVPRDQSLNNYYAGIFHFRFWQYGKWQDVIIDDMLPTYYDQLVFMHSKTKNEFWCALLEKAYAKLYGCYEALRGGNINESMVDLTGGVVEMIDLRNPPNNLFSVMRKAYRRGALMGCAIEPQNPNIQTEAVLTNGLIVRHAYSVTRVTCVDIASAAPKAKAPCSNGPVDGGDLQNAFGSFLKPLMGMISPTGAEKAPRSVPALGPTLANITNFNINLAFPDGKAELVRLHNPWGNEAEWTGSWSDKSPEWGTIAPEDRERLGLTFDDDGEFWMSFLDFIRNFTTVEICDVTPEVFDLGDEDEESNTAENILKRWQMVMYEGAWVSHHSAGGCRNFIDTFITNPQYTVVLEDPDEDDDDDLCTIVISIMQKNVRQLKRYGADYNPIGFTVYKKPDDKQIGERLDKEFFMYNMSVAKVKFFLNTREVTERFRFPPGAYVIVPSTFEPEMTGEFLLRIFYEAKRLKITK